MTYYLKDKSDNQIILMRFAFLIRKVNRQKYTSQVLTALNIFNCLYFLR